MCRVSLIHFLPIILPMIWIIIFAKKYLNYLNIKYSKNKILNFNYNIKLLNFIKEYNIYVYHIVDKY